MRLFLVKHKEEIQHLISTVDPYLSNLAIILWWLRLVPVLAIFFLRDFLRDGGQLADVPIQLFFPRSCIPGFLAPQTNFT